MNSKFQLFLELRDKCNSIKSSDITLLNCKILLDINNYTYFKTLIDDNVIYFDSDIESDVSTTKQQFEFYVKKKI